MGCEAYKDDAEMEGDHVCPTHKARCVERSEENYFFALSKYQAQIQARDACSGALPCGAHQRHHVGWKEPLQALAPCTSSHAQTCHAVRRHAVWPSFQ